MCGFVGVVAPGARHRFAGRVRAASLGLAHRGPDSDGYFEDDDCVLGFRRLAILDLEHGGQPMRGEDGSVLVCNGEIYNFRELAASLPPGRLRTRSDSEVALATLEREGAGALARFDGMFALARWEPRRRSLLLARDRLGIKPLYHARLGDAFLFASEIRALLALGLRAAAHPPAIDVHASFLWNPGPETAFAGIRRLPPGTSLELRDGIERPSRYWRMAPCPGSGRPDPEAVREAVVSDVRRQLVSDVPVGIFLSGGLDSSFIACALPGDAVKRAYTLSFPRRDLSADIVRDETRYARLLARARGIELVEVPLEFSPERFLHSVRALEEPVGDPAAIATIALSSRAEEKVLLSGMGGDELWGGYPRFRALELSRYLPGCARPLLEAAERLLPHAGLLGRFGRNAAKFGSAAGLPWAARHVRFLSYLAPEERAGLLGPALRGRVGGSAHERLLLARPAGGDDLDVSLRFEVEQFLPCHNLLYTDKASMAASKEVRVPLLGNAVLETAERLPAGLRRGKRLLRRAAEGIVPREILARRKAGFGAPVQGWLRGPLRPLLDEYLSPAALGRRGWFEPAAVRRLVDDEWAGRSHRYLLIYELLVLEAWAREFLDRAA
ncbi:MAG TPA: asparagine synthase (glutamine-hydrolyzing) [Planctomycetota bacterium]|nr:asparagine synthase (glutamine-hydrolyzing) [Planctomycetota bacterium]